MKKGILLVLLFLVFSCKIRRGEDGNTSQNIKNQTANFKASHTDSVYLFTSFREPADEGLYLAYSNDGYNWENLAGPYLKPTVGKSKIMRDPSVTKGKDSTYHMVWTTDWRGGKGFGYASTTDFISWSEPRMIPVMDHEPDVVNVWAPELFYDKDLGRFIILWASTIPFQFEKGEEEEKNNHRMYFTTTKDFKDFTKTELFIDAGFSMIDCVIVKRDTEDYVLVLKDNTRPNRNLKVAFASNPLGTYKNISEPFTGFLTEGPTVIQQDGKYIIYYDNYGDKSFGAVETENFKEFKNISDKIELPEGHKHGTITRISNKVLNGLIAKSKELK
ncbi:glycoside hydrolase family 43 protein [Zunongwangia endophytica]|uniref:Family 43 glycosylhydrolase n=1 Tax=Zunongwangia endophytica TaxID=1808945 RepID=A0ABV8H734_9FLAO|nr:glycoside hydrolase family 43 protein [Zunongwangia endophytica]MDN3594825.1 glycoside hydrolase family 43 protein [Zunongwangia endophytica]